MSQTIRIKRGTGNSVPSSLEEGELAINLDSGKLYYGSGSSVSSNFAVETLTAENYIISSSVTHMTTSFSSGSTAFGDSVSDEHTFTGNITASGNISASGVVHSLDSIVLKGLSIGDSLNTGSLFVGPSARGIELRGGSTWTSTNPKIYSPVATIDVLSNFNMNSNRVLFHEGSSNSYIGVNSDTPDDLEIYANQDLSLIPDNETIISSSAGLGLKVYGGINSLSDITASGHVSASGDISADRFYSEGHPVGMYTAAAMTLGYENNTPIRIGKSANPITMNGDVTASGHVSASGTLAGSNLSGTNTGDQTSITGNAGTATALASGNQTIAGNLVVSTTTGNASLTIAADPNNDDESKNSYIKLSQDGGGIGSYIGHVGDAGDAPNDLPYSGTTANALLIGISGSTTNDIQFGTDNTVRMTINNNGDVTTEGRSTFNGRATFNDLAVFTDTIIGNNLDVDQTVLLPTSLHATYRPAQGNVIYTATGSTVAGGIYYLKGSGTWHAASATVNYGTTMLGMAVGTSALADGMLVSGLIHPTSNPAGEPGVPIYLSTTAGGLSKTKPTATGDVVRIIGYSTGTTAPIYFSPDNTWIEIA